MIVAGIRCTPHKVYYTIIEIKENDSFSLVHQELIIPKSFDVPNKLKYIRKTLLDIFKEYNVVRAGIRITENNAQSPDLFRIMLEAVIQELIASSNVEAYFTGVKGSIGSKLGIGNDGAIGLLIDGSQDYNNITDWKLFSKEHRESILVGFASINL
jgi:predicted CopG family antitoxin